MKRIRTKFIKGESLKFLSHLDILRTFGRALRRGSINVAYSKGFNPHQQMSFAQPLPVGTTSECEYVDIDFDEDIDVNSFVERINSALPKDLNVVSAVEVENNSNIMAIINEAKYRVRIYGENPHDISKDIDNLMSTDKILIEKKTKSGIKEVDIRPKIKELKQTERNEEYIEIFMHIDSGSVSNLKPENVLSAMHKYFDLNIEDYDIHRLELLY